MYGRVILAMLAFAANSVLCRTAIKNLHIDPITFSGIRIVSGALMLILFLFASRPVRTPEMNWFNSLSLSLYIFAFSLAYSTIDTGPGALLLFGAVQLSMTGWGVYKGEKMPLLKISGIVLAFTGMIILLLPGTRTPSLSASALMIISGIAWAVYCITGKKVNNAVEATTGNFLMAIPFAALITLMLGKDIHTDMLGIILAVISGALTSALAYVLWYALLPFLSSSMASTVQLSVPCFAALGGVIFMGEDLGLRTILATIIILGGIGIVIGSEKYRKH